MRKAKKVSQQFVMNWNYLFLCSPSYLLQSHLNLLFSPWIGKMQIALVLLTKDKLFIRKFNSLHQWKSGLINFWQCDDFNRHVKKLFLTMTMTKTPFWHSFFMKNYRINIEWKILKRYRYIKNKLIKWNTLKKMKYVVNILVRFNV